MTSSGGRLEKNRRLRLDLREEAVALALKKVRAHQGGAPHAGHLPTRKKKKTPRDRKAEQHPGKKPKHTTFKGNSEELADKSKLENQMFLVDKPLETRPFSFQRLASTVSMSTQLCAKAWARHPNSNPKELSKQKMPLGCLANPNDTISKEPQAALIPSLYKASPVQPCLWPGPGHGELTECSITKHVSPKNTCLWRTWETH